MNRLVLGSITVIFISLYYTQWSSPRRGKVVNTTSGCIEGIVSVSRDGRDFDEWLGIPYAQPPVGSLRFADPKPAKPWTGVRDGSKYGSVCPQALRLGSTTWGLGSEDCLFLNIHAPKTGQEHIGSMAKLPVMVWFHGGGYFHGSSNNFPPDYFMDEDVVLVTVNYRLHVFGFLCPGGPHVRGNMGLKDQVVALRWVRDNIQAFGGDSNKITIFGESAGAASVHHHMLSPTTRGLFHKVIAQSGVATVPWAIHSAEDARKLANKLATSLGCYAMDTHGENGRNNTGVAMCLRSQNKFHLLRAISEYSDNWYVSLPHMTGQHFRPCINEADGGDQGEIDGSFITEHPLDVVTAGRAQRIPLMIGAMADEGLLSTMALLQNEERLISFEENWTANVARAFSIPEKSFKVVQITNKLREYYVPGWRKLTRGQRIAAYTRMLGDAHFYLHIHNVAERQRQFSPVYAYYYTRRGGSSLAPMYAEYLGKLPLLGLGAFHGDDLVMLSPVAFINIQRNDQDPDYLFSKALIKLWVDFASSEDTRTLYFRGAPFPPSRQNGSVEYLDITDANPEMIRAPFEDRVEFLKSLGLLRPEYL